MTPNRHRAQVLRAAAATAVLAGSLLAAGNAAEASASPLSGGVRAGAPMDADGSVKYYIVGRDRDGKPEFLYSIAQKVLGDGSRFNEIFELNRNRVQADGGVLTRPTVIEVGWVLQLPDDAKGEGVRFGKLPATPGSVSSPEPPSSAPAAPQPQAVDAPAGGSNGIEGLTPVLGVGAAALVIGTVGGFAIHRRRPARAAAAATAAPAAFVASESTAATAAPSATSVTTSVAAPDSSRAAVPERAPATTRSAARIARPVAAPATSPSVAQAARRAAAPAAPGTEPTPEPSPSPTSAPVATTAVAPRRNGVRGSASRPRTAEPSPQTTRTFHVAFGDDVVDVRLAGTGGAEGETSIAWMPVPYDIPEGGGVFLCIGSSDTEGCLFVDLAQAPGTVAVGGDLEAARRLLESLLLQLGVSPALDQASVVATGTLAAMTEGLPRVKGAASLAEVADRRAEEAAPPVEFVFGSLDAEADHAALTHLLRGPGRVVPIVLGEPETADWTFTVRPAPAA